MSSDEPKLSPLQEKIKELENTYKELNSRLINSTDTVRVDESALLVCLRQLMPLLKTPKSGSASELKELEEQSTKLSSNLDRSNEKVRVDESALLACLRQLMPLQNSYLGGIIDALQTQLKEQAKKHADELAEIDADNTDVVPVPKPRFRLRRLTTPTIEQVNE
jgi:hypothetical protein